MEKLEVLTQTIHFKGHRNVLCTHRNTVEITKDECISKRADCILGVEASCGCRDLHPDLKAHIKAGGSLRFEIRVKNFVFIFSGKGSPNLELTDPQEIVLRRSDYGSPRTAAILCDSAAIDIPRPMIDFLKNPDTEGEFKISALNEIRLPESEIPEIVFAGLID
ncbi:MAG: DUF371 domain-containing protein [Thaumarchaeota archaeon]|nr:DUF371 domain-containing protein [Nitrososphaerota archaeon]